MKMKEIKVRLWYPKRREMSLPLSIWSLPDYDNLPEKPIVLLHVFLKDIHGEEIYDGDIVRADFRGSKGIGYISFEDRREIVFLIELIVNELGETQPEFFDTTKNIEVIGNIYENPEILKEKS